MSENKSDFNSICITKTAATITALLDVPPAQKMASPIEEVLSAAKTKLDSPKADRVFIYNPDAIAMWIFEKYRSYFKELEKEADLSLKMLSVYPPVTPVCFASMYSGLMPSDHGIQAYVKPVLQVPTIFDQIPSAGKKAAIVSTAGDSISCIFLNRNVDYYIYKTKEECNKKALELIKEDKYDFIELYNGDYDHWMHRVTPDGFLAKKALKENIATWLELSASIKENWKKHKTVLGFCPDHGCHHSFPKPGDHGKNKPCDMNIMHFYKFLPYLA